MLQTEVWRPAPAYEGIYEISSYGRVRRLRYSPQSAKGKILTPIRLKSGYLAVRLHDHGRDRTCYLHRLVAEAFIPVSLASKRLQVNHKDGRRDNNGIDNLEWCTNQENTIHAFTQLGRSGPQGELSGKTNLTNYQVRCIKRMLRLGITRKRVQDRFGVSKQVVASIARGTRWGSIN